MDFKWLPIEKSNENQCNLKKNIIMFARLIPENWLAFLLGRKRQKCHQSSCIYQIMRNLNFTDISSAAFEIHRGSTHLTQLVCSAHFKAGSNAVLEHQRSVWIEVWWSALPRMAHAHLSNCKNQTRMSLKRRGFEKQLSKKKCKRKRVSVSKVLLKWPVVSKYTSPVLRISGMKIPHL